VFLFGILSSPLPYLLMAVFYFFGFASGIFKGDADAESGDSIQVSSIQLEKPDQAIIYTEKTYHFQEFQKHETTNLIVVKAFAPQNLFQDTSNIFYIHDIDVHRFNFSETQFSRPPPCIV